MATLGQVSVVLISDKSNDDYGVYIRVSLLQQRAHFFTGFKTALEQWDKENGKFTTGKNKRYKVTRVINGSKVECNQTDANAEIASQKSKADDIVRKWNADNTEWTIQMFKDAYQPGIRVNNFIEYMTAAMDKLKQSGEPGKQKRAEIMKGTIRSLVMFDKGISNKAFQDIDKAFIERYVDWCQKPHSYEMEYKNKKGDVVRKETITTSNNASTIRMRLAEIRCILNEAAERNLYAGTTNPFGTGSNKVQLHDLLKKCQADSTNNRTRDKDTFYFGLDSLRMINNYESDSITLNTTKHLFIASIRLNGMNYKDMAKLTTANVKETILTTGETAKKIIFKRSKTSEEIAIIITPDIQKELDWFRNNTVLFGNYLFPIIRKDVPKDKYNEYVDNSRRRANDALATICKELNLPEGALTFYAARHSFAMGMREQGETIENISAGLNHKSILTTRAYLARHKAEEISKHTRLDF